MNLKKMIRKVAAVGAGATMVGATLMGALATSLADYPSPFVSDGVFDAVLVVGDNAAAADIIGVTDIAMALQFNMKTTSFVEVSAADVAVTDGDTEEVALGAALTATGGLDATYDDDDISNLVDTSVDINGTDYDYHTEIQLGNTGLLVATSMAGSDKEYDYGTNVHLEVAKNDITYCVVFDEAVDLYPNIDADEPLELDFLGSTLKITGIASNTSVTAQAGTEFFMNAGDTVQVDGKDVTFVKAGSDSAVVIVDGDTETINEGSTESVGGLKVKVEDLFNEDGTADDSATLIVGEEASKTYSNGDEYIGQDEDDPDWVWKLAGLDPTVVGSSQTLCIENDFVYDDDTDNPPGLGEYLSLPGDFVQVGLDSLTVSSYMDVTISYETSIDLSNAYDTTGTTSAAVVKIWSSEDEGLQINVSGTWKGTDTVYMWPDTDDKFRTFYLDSDNKVTNGTLYAATTMYANAELVRINYKDTKATDLVVYGQGSFNNTANGTGSFVLQLNDGVNSEALTMNFTSTASEPGFNGLGVTADSEEAAEVDYDGTDIGTKDEDLRTAYGYLIFDQENSGASDKVKLSIPGDQVKANAVVKAGAASVSGTTEITTESITQIGVGAARLASEAGDVTAMNAIVVGGPCANSAAMTLMGNPSPCYAGFTEGEAMVKLYENGGNTALLVAGATADDTRTACKLVANGGITAVDGMEAVVTTLTESVTAPTAAAEESAEESTE